MCGIIGAILRSGSVSKALFEGLRKLEYRGYDSVGVATMHEGKIYLKKDRGKINEVNEKLNLKDLPGSIGVGHTRWATHGLPDRINAHPFLDCRGRIAIVHNGIIENFLELKDKLRGKGHKFTSNTDTEVIVHLIEEEAEEESLEKAILKAVKKLKGSFALGVISADEPDKLIGVRKESPLIIGLSDEGKFISSDVVGFLNYTDKVVYLRDGEMAVLTRDSVRVMNFEDGELVKFEVKKVDWKPEQATKGGFKHFMLKEIFEQPYAIADALRTPMIYLERFVDYLVDSERVFFVACGTSYHASIFASYVFSKVAGIKVIPAIASEFIENYLDVVDEKSLIVAISQSGETADTLGAVKAAKGRGAKTLGIVNVMGSTLTRIVDRYIGQNAGPEIGVAATKTYTSQLSILSRVAVYSGVKNGKISIVEGKNLLSDLHKVSVLIKDNIERISNETRKIAPYLASNKSICFLGRGVNYPTALEARLKMLEISYIPAVAYPSGESKHGFIALVEENYPIVIFAPEDATYRDNLSTLMEMKARGGRVIAVTEGEVSEIKGEADIVVETPTINSLFTPITMAVVGQLMAYHTADYLGRPIDTPRSLAKSVTVK